METFRACVLFLACVAAADKGKKQAKSRDLLWVDNNSALKYLTEELGDMKNFKLRMLSPLVIERVSGTEGNKKVQMFIKSSLPTWHIEEDSFKETTPNGELEFNNIIATFDPNKPTKIVLACHFDSKYMPDVKYVGATDSAVPCAILLDTARQLQCLMEKGPLNESSAKNLTLQMIFFDGEEAFKQWSDTDSIYGSRHLAKKWSVEPDPSNSNITRLDAIREMILLDLIGTKDTTIPQLYSSTSDLYGNLVKTEQYLRSNKYLVGNNLNPIFNGQQHFGRIEDDHKPFMHREVDIVHLISAPFPQVWHKSTDDWDHLDFNLIDNFSRIFRVFISNLLHLRPEERSCR